MVSGFGFMDLNTYCISYIFLYNSMSKCALLYIFMSESDRQSERDSHTYRQKQTVIHTDRDRQSYIQTDRLTVLLMLKIAQRILMMYTACFSEKSFTKCMKSKRSRSFFEGSDFNARPREKVFPCILFFAEIKCILAKTWEKLE